MTLNKKDMKKRLHENIVSFKFKKSDGSIRQMYGTRNATIIADLSAPVDESVATNKPTKKVTNKPTIEPDHLIRVFDSVAQGWRSFKIDSVVEWDI